MMKWTSLVLVCLLWCYYCSSGLAFVSKKSQGHSNDLTNYFINTPVSITVFIGQNDSAEVFGDFHCATRHDYRPLWIVNGLSVALIQDTPGYNGTYSEYLPLQGEGNTLSFLSIPASAATNNSIVSCAAQANETIAIYADPAHLIVLEVNKTASMIPILPSTTALYLPSSSLQPESTPPPKNGPDNRSTELIALSSILFLLLCAAVITLILITVFVVIKQRKDFTKISVAKAKRGDCKADANIYWNAKEQTVISTKKPYLDEQYKKDFPVKV